MAAGALSTLAQQVVLSDATFGAVDKFPAGETAQSANFRLSQPTFETFAGIVGSAELTMQIGWLPTTVEEQLPPPDLPVNDLDLLSDVTALHGETLEFLVSSTKLSGALTFSLDRSSPTAQLVRGELSLTAYGPATALFRYTPSSEDVVGFDLTITAKDTQGKQTSAEFTVAPSPILPAEESFIQSVIPAPDPESGDYIVHTDVESPTSEPWYGENRKTRAVSVAGKVLILADGHPNRILSRYSMDRQNIKTFDMYAERVVLKNPMYLQGATITIYARELIYENGATFVDVSQVRHVSGPITWLQPPTLRIILAYTRDLYISGRGPETRAILRHYRDFLEGMAQSGAWSSYEEEAQNEFEQMHGEMTTMLWNLDRNLDYFGNPAGWVPNLSFEVNLGFFNSEIETAIRKMYLSYWLGNVATSAEAKVNAMTTSRVALHDEIAGMRDELETIKVRLPKLQDRAVTLTADLEDLQNRIKQREEELRREFENQQKKNKWRKIAKQVGGIMQVVPVFQPALAAVGTGMSAIANLDQNSGLADWGNAIGAVGGIVGGFTKTDWSADWNKVTDYTKNTLSTLDPTQIKEGGLKDYLAKVRSFGTNLRAQIKPLGDKLKKIEADDKVLQALLAGTKAQAPEFNQQILTSDGRLNGLLDEVKRRLAEQRDLNNEITESIKTMGRLQDTIARDMLAMDALSQDIAKNNGALNLRAITYLKDMGKRAKERLLKYQYYMTKAYEYRLLRPYEGDLNMGTLFDKLVTLAEADPNGNGTLTQAHFDSLASLYTDQVAELTARIVDRYNEEPLGHALPFSYGLNAVQLDQLNAGEPVIVNLVEDRRIPQRREDLQINRLDIQMGVDVVGERQLNEVFSLTVSHSGESKMKLGEEVFLFRHNNTSAQNPFQRDHQFHWEAEYSSTTQSVTERTPASGDLRLLQFLLGLRGVPPTDANLGLFSRAGVWSDLTLRRRDDEAGTRQRYRITSVVFTVAYDYRDQPLSLRALDVFTANAAVHPVIKVDNADLVGRKDGLRRLHRTYSWPPSGPIRLTAPEVFGSWRFEKWTDGSDVELGRQFTLDVLLDDNKRVVVHYMNTDTDEDSMPDAQELVWFGSLDRGAADDPDGDGLNDFAEMVYGTNPSLRDTDGDGFDDAVEIAAGSDPTTSASMPLHFSEVVHLGAGSFRLRWPSEVGRTYVVEGIGRLGGGDAWQPVTELTATAAIGEVIMESGASQRYFRLRTGGVPLLEAPKIVVQPKDVTIQRGEVATFSVEATGTGPLAYQWYMGDRGDTANQVPGATTAVFSTPPLEASASYWVRVSNAAGVDDSRSATATVFTPPDVRETYVSNYGGDSVSVLDRETLGSVATILVGQRPIALTSAPDGRRVFVVNHDSANVSVIDTASRQLVATVGVGVAPYGLAMSRDGQRLYVANSGSSSISVIDPSTIVVVATVPTQPNPTTVAYHPVRDEVWIWSDTRLEARLAVDYTVLASVTSTTRYYASSGLAFLPDGSEAFGVEGCGCCGRFHRISGVHAGGTISVIQKDILYDNKGSAMSVAIDPVNGRTYFAKSGHCSGGVPRIYEFGSGRSVDLAAVPAAMTVDSDAGRLWVAQGNGVVVIVDTATLSVVGAVTVGSNPQGVTLVNYPGR